MKKFPKLVYLAFEDDSDGNEDYLVRLYGWCVFDGTRATVRDLQARRRRLCARTKVVHLEETKRASAMNVLNAELAAHRGETERELAKGKR